VFSCVCIDNVDVDGVTVAYLVCFVYGSSLLVPVQVIAWKDASLK